MSEKYQFNQIKDFLVMSYNELEERNLEMKSLYKQFKSQEFFREKIVKYLTDEKRIKAICVCFTDLEGRLMSLDYDKIFLLKNSHNLTFDGSSIKGFSTQDKSDLFLDVDWSSFRWLPSDIFGPGKVLMFANVLDQNKEQYQSDFRGLLKKFVEKQRSENDYTFNIAPEIEGFLLKGIDAEQNFDDNFGFELITKSGYYNSLPQDKLRIFIDIVAEAKRAMGFENEKDHPEVAPSQFELNYKYNNAVEACDQIQIYKLLCRQIAKTLDCTASFLPKPSMNINGSGMHLNLSVSSVASSKNLFFDKDQHSLSDFGKNFASGILYHAKDLSLILNSSVNSYRRLDPKFEAPNEIKMSKTNRAAMIRIPLADENSTRIEVRSVAPDCNSYLTVFSILQAGLSANKENIKKYHKIFDKREKLPGNIYDAIRYFDKSDFLLKIMTNNIHQKYSSLKEEVANRCPKNLGTSIKKSEIIYHHEITNQSLWYRF